MAGELNGTDVVLAIETTPGGGTYAAVGGLTANSLTLNNTPIDITNKSSASWRTLLAGEGLQTMDITGEMVFNTDTAFAQLKALALSKAFASFEIDRGGEALTVTCMVASWAETSPDNEKLTATVSLQSSGAVVGL